MLLRTTRRIFLLAAAVALGWPAAPAVASTPTWTTPVVRFEPAAGATLQVEGLGEFRGSIELRRTASGLSVVNEVGLEDYVAGIQEVPASWPAAAQEAQAIAARTYALRMMRSPGPVARAAAAHICATQACQVYTGLQSERRPGGERWRQAVARTAGRAVLHRGVPIVAKYASSNGGRSDAGGAPYLPAVDDPDDLAVSPWARWRSVLPLAAVDRALPGPGELVELNRAGDVVVTRRRQPDGTIVDRGYAPLAVRRALNTTAPTPPGVPVPVPSIRFVARTENGAAILDGGGYGHLLGMSQYGALGKARRGFSADQILAAYYGGLPSVALPPDQLPPVIRVVIGTDLAGATVSSTGRFRVRAADGGAIAHLAGGTWSAASAGPALRVSSTSPDAAIPAMSLDPIGRSALRLSLTTAAAVEVREAGVARALGVVPAGTHDVPLVTAVPEGEVVPVEVVADAGGGRIVRQVVDVGEARPSAAALPPTTPGDERAGGGVRAAAAVRPRAARGEAGSPLPAVAAGSAVAAVAWGAVTAARSSRSSRRASS